MNPAPLAKVLKVVREISGKTDRGELVKLINGVLEMLYRDQNCLWKYFQTNGCAQIQRFSEPCRNSRLTGFSGVVMPVNVTNVRELMTDDVRFQITEERVNPTCSTRNNHCDPLAEHLPPRLFERDIPACGDNGQVTFYTDCADDCGLLVGVRYLDHNDKEQREDIELSTGRRTTSVSVKQFLEVTFPERQGFITAETVDGTLLGRYHPSVYIPVHEWFRLQGGCPGQVISYRGLQTLTPVVFDTDPVVFSDSFYWRLAIKAYQHVDSMELTPGQNNGLARIFNQLAQAGQADLSAENDNFNAVAMPNLAKASLGAARVFSRRGRFARY